MKKPLITQQLSTGTNKWLFDTNEDNIAGITVDWEEHDNKWTVFGIDGNSLYETQIPSAVNIAEDDDTPKYLVKYFESIADSPSLFSEM